MKFRIIKEIFYDNDCNQKQIITVQELITTKIFKRLKWEFIEESYNIYAIKNFESVDDAEEYIKKRFAANPRKEIVKEITKDVI